MDEKFSYQDYVNDKKFLDDYNDYQKKYANNIRESDKVIISLVKEHVAKHGDDQRLRLLDIGCSTGNLLKHIKYQVPGLELYGGELAESSLEVCRNDPELQDISFEKMDILDIGKHDYFDVVIANAVSVYFKWEEYEKAQQSIFKSLRKNGVYIIFEWLHPFVHQDLMIYETSVSHPEGMRICFRPMQKVQQCMEKAGFDNVHFMPFEMPFDLPETKPDEEVVSYTVMSKAEKRMTFRGALYQPWCHMTAEKS